MSKEQKVEVSKPATTSEENATRGDGKYGHLYNKQNIKLKKCSSLIEEKMKNKSIQAEVKPRSFSESEIEFDNGGKTWISYYFFL